MVKSRFNKDTLPMKKHITIIAVIALAIGGLFYIYKELTPLTAHEHFQKSMQMLTDPNISEEQAKEAMVHLDEAINKKHEMALITFASILLAEDPSQENRLISLNIIDDIGQKSIPSQSLKNNLITEINAVKQNPSLEPILYVYEDELKALNGQQIKKLHRQANAGITYSKIVLARYYWEGADNQAPHFEKADEFFTDLYFAESPIGRIEYIMFLDEASKNEERALSEASHLFKEWPWSSVEYYIQFLADTQNERAERTKVILEKYYKRYQEQNVQKEARKDTHLKRFGHMFSDITQYSKEDIQELEKRRHKLTKEEAEVLMFAYWNDNMNTSYNELAFGVYSSIAYEKGSHLAHILRAVKAYYSNEEKRTAFLYLNQLDENNNSKQDLYELYKDNQVVKQIPQFKVIFDDYTKSIYYKEK